MMSSCRSALGQFDNQTDVGSVNRPGSCEYAEAQQAYTIRTSGANIWGNHDDFHFVWKRMSGNFIVTMRAAFVGKGANPHRKLGWMARANLDAGSPHVSTGIHGDGLVSLQFRRTPGGPTGEARASQPGADVIQLERKGHTYIMSAARYGRPFEAVQVADSDLGEAVYVGLFVCSHEADVVEQAAFQDVRIVVPVKADFERGRDPFGSRLELVDIATGHRQIIYSSEAIFEAPNWSRDGKALIYNRDGRLVRFDLATRTPAFIDTGEVVRNNNDHVLSFDGSMLAISSHSEAGFTPFRWRGASPGSLPPQIHPTFTAGRPMENSWSTPASATASSTFIVFRWMGGRKRSSRTPLGWMMGRNIRRTAGISISTRFAAGACNSGG